VAGSFIKSEKSSIDNCEMIICLLDVVLAVVEFLDHGVGMALVILE
jgi:hypothetical protein